MRITEGLQDYLNQRYFAVPPGYTTGNVTWSGGAGAGNPYWTGSTNWAGGYAPVTLCRSTNGTTCAGSGGWEGGWIVLSGTTVLQRHAALPSDFRIAQGTFGALIFPPDVVGATAATFTVCRATPIGKQKRTVRITASGGTSVARVDSATTCP